MSKLFEGILLDICQDYFIIDELQFGFKLGHIVLMLYLHLNLLSIILMKEVAVFMLLPLILVRLLTVSITINCLAVC